MECYSSYADFPSPDTQKWSVHDCSFRSLGTIPLNLGPDLVCVNGSGFVAIIAGPKFVVFALDDMHVHRGENRARGRPVLRSGNLAGFQMFACKSRNVLLQDSSVEDLWT